MAWELADNIRGPKGDKGNAGTISSVSVATLPAGSSAEVDMSGTTDVHVDFRIPRGDKGEQGLPGTLSSASAESVPASEQAEVIMSGTTEVKHAHFKVPRGLPGVNALENDAAMAAYIAATDSETRQQLDVRIDAQIDSQSTEADSAISTLVGTGSSALRAAILALGPTTDRVAIKPAEMATRFGTSNLSAAGAVGVPHRELPDGALTTLRMTSVIPAHWTTFSIVLVAANDTAAVGAVRLNLAVHIIENTQGSGFLSTAVTLLDTTIVALGSGLRHEVQIATGVTRTSFVDGLLSVSVARDGAHAEDTLAGLWDVVEVQLRKLS